MVDQEKIEKAFATIIEAIGDDPKREGLTYSPKRVARMYAEVFSGIDEDPAEPLGTGFEEGHGELVMVKDVRFSSMCEHHFLPFTGTAVIAYIPNGRIVGVSKLVRALEILAGRPQVQERLASQLADVIDSSLKARGVAVVLTAEHMCMSCRGVRKPGHEMVTSVSRGLLLTHESKRQELFALLGRR